MVVNGWSPHHGQILNYYFYVYFCNKVENNNLSQDELMQLILSEFPLLSDINTSNFQAIKNKILPYQ